MADHHHHSRQGAAEEDGLAEMLDLDGTVLRAYHDEVMSWLGELAPARRIVDLGAGTGVGTLALARQFGAADVIAVDVSAGMLHRLARKVREQGLSARVHTHQADLDVGWPAIEPVDLVWMSNALHHLADADRSLAEIARGLRPGGRLAIAEMNAFPRFLPDGFGGGLEQRCQALLAEQIPQVGDDWNARLRKAGFVVEAERRFTTALTAPLPDEAARYALLFLHRLRAGLHDRLDANDLAALDALVTDGPQNVMHRDDLVIRPDRTVWIASRPA
jgi:ubiquinone/menaquinone biosynthesis C-methylase UbiE